MDNAQAIRFALAFGYWDRARATLTLIVERPVNLALTLIWPLIGMGLAVFALDKGVPFTGWVWLGIVLALLFMPIMVLFGTAMTHFFNRQAREPFTYTFDADGIHVSAVTYEYTHKWPAIFKVKRKFGFLLFFFSPGMAHCLPLRDIPDPALQAALVSMAAAHGADVRSV